MFGGIQRFGMEFEKKINLGHILAAGSILASAVLFAASTRMEIKQEATARRLNDEIILQEQQAAAEQRKSIIVLIDKIESRVSRNEEHRLTDEARWDN